LLHQVDGPGDPPKASRSGPRLRRTAAATSALTATRAGAAPRTTSPRYAAATDSAALLATPAR